MWLYIKMCIKNNINYNNQNIKKLVIKYDNIYINIEKILEVTLWQQCTVLNV